jgi:predicted Na+-dependent transporter
VKAALAWAGKNGAWVVIGGVALGFAVPELAALARPWLAAAIFVFTFGSLLKFDLASFREEWVQARRNAAMAAWAAFGVPLLVAALIHAWQPSEDLAQGLLFWALVPPSGACVAFAVLLGLRTPLALLATVAATAASPFYLPWLAAALGGLALTIDPAAMSLRLLGIVGGAWLASLLVKRFAGAFVRGNPDAMTGIAVAALFVAGLGSMRGMWDAFAAEPAQVIGLLALAYALIAASLIAGALLFWRSGRAAALTAGLIGATRTITMAWVVLGDDVLPLADVFLGCAMVAKYTTPALVKAWCARLLAGDAPPSSTAGEAPPCKPLRVPPRP